MLGPEDLRKWLDEKGVDAEILELGSRTATSAEAAKALNVGEESIVKTIVFVDDRGGGWLVIVPATKKVWQTRLAKALGLRKLRLARREEVISLTGYEPGAVPPVGHLGKARVVVDRRLLEMGFVYAGGGGLRHLLRIRGEDIVALQRALVLDVPSKQ